MKRSFRESGNEAERISPRRPPAGTPVECPWRGLGSVDWSGKAFAPAINAPPKAVKWESKEGNPAARARPKPARAVHST